MPWASQPSWPCPPRRRPSTPTSLPWRTQRYCFPTKIDKQKNYIFCIYEGHRRVVGRLRHLRLRRPARVRAGQLRIQVSGKTGISDKAKQKRAEKVPIRRLVHTWGGSQSGRDVALVPKDRVPHLSTIQTRRRTNGERHRRREEDEPGPKKGLGKQFRKSLFLAFSPLYLPSQEGSE